MRRLDRRGGSRGREEAHARKRLAKGGHATKVIHVRMGEQDPEQRLAGRANHSRQQPGIGLQEQRVDHDDAPLRFEPVGIDVVRGLGRRVSVEHDRVDGRRGDEQRGEREQQHAQSPEGDAATLSRSNGPAGSPS